MTPSAVPSRILPPPSPEEAAAVVAALETFMRATAPAAQPPSQAIDPWQRAALLEGVMREPEADVQHPWINT
jgi:cell division protein FtsN